MGPRNRLIDVSHTVSDGLETYPGLPTPVICDYLSREQSRQHYSVGTEFQIGRIDMVANTGTYLDAPFHRYPEGMDLAQLPLTSLADLAGLVVRVPKRREIGARFFQGLDVRQKAVLVHTGWSRHWNSARYFEGHPFLTAPAAEYLRQQEVALVGIDSLNIDDTSDGSRPVHSTLLAANVPIVEHLTRLEQLPDGEFRFFAVPVKVQAFGSFPVRAFAIAAE
ncbi:MAG: cyclase family protein [Candidatus Promineifilaceae bacterium]|nr:cyclase family protein [Candidatus Promineifilaceae bacterium]